ncbi:cytochrome o ubiquinol oxidase subunit IV [Buchnera aphidicola]|uniref:cytochrome o ubiquinol oxidase subunit IV n=1 Tax=Buchnera aphidicola TaxID=9 RepID=UPI003BEF216D
MSNNSNNLLYYKKKSYILGFLFSIILTLIPFYFSIEKIFSSKTNHIIIIFCAITQILIHFIYFLDLNFSIEKRWNIVSLLFIMIIIFIILFGSIWIMNNLNNNMMMH